MQKVYSQYNAIAFAGQVDGLGTPRVRSLKNVALDTQNTWTIGIPATVDNSATYTVSATGGEIPSGGISASFATDGSATQAELGAGLFAALKASDFAQYFAISLASNTITLRAVSYGIPYTITSPTNATTTNDLTLTETLAAASSAAIPYGRFVVRKTDAPADSFDEARLPTTASNVEVAGIVIAPTHANERTAVGNTAEAAYQPKDAMNVLTHQGSTDGTWVQCDSASLTAGSTLYIDTQVASNRGGLTATSTSNLALPATCKAVSNAALDFNGVPIIKISANLPA